MEALIICTFFYYIYISTLKFDKYVFGAIILLPLLLIVAIRPFDWGADANTYIEMYNMVNSNHIVHTEATFSLISKFVFSTGNYVKLLFLCYAIISVPLKINLITRISYFPAASLLIYFSCWYVLHDIYQIRVGTAIALSYISIYHLCKKNTLLYLLTAFCASLFHTQAIVLFLLILLPKSKISLYTVLALCSIIIFSYGLYFFNIDALNGIVFLLTRTNFPRAEQIKYYYEIAQSGIIDLGKINALSPIVLIRLFLSLTLLFQYKKLNSLFYYPVLIRIMIISFAVRMFCYPAPVIGMRIYEFLTCFDVFVFPLFFKIIREKKIVFALLIFYCLFMLFLLLRS